MKFSISPGTRTRFYQSPVFYLLTLLIITGLWAWFRRRVWIWTWLRRRQSSQQRLVSRPSQHQFDIPASLRLQTSRGLILITAAESTALHLDLFCNLTQQTKSDGLVAFRPIPHQTVRQIHAKVRTQSLQQSQQKGLTFFVFHGDELVGCLGFSRLDPMTGSGELDLVIQKQYWVDGWAQDLHLSILDYGFDVLHLQRVLCGIDRSNRIVRAFFEDLHWNLVSVGRAGSPNMYNYVLPRQKFHEETRAALISRAAISTNTDDATKSVTNNIQCSKLSA